MVLWDAQLIFDHADGAHTKTIHVLVSHNSDSRLDVHENINIYF